MIRAVPVEQARGRDARITVGVKEVCKRLQAAGLWHGVGVENEQMSASGVRHAQVVGSSVAKIAPDLQHFNLWELTGGSRAAIGGSIVHHDHLQP